MQVIGFNFSKISAEKITNVKKPEINTHIEFLDVDKEKVEFLKDLEAIKVEFEFKVDYKEKESKSEKLDAEVSFKGRILLSVTKDEAKEITKHWKKKEIPLGVKLPLFNLILRKCSIKSLELEESVGLPTHVPLPVLRPEKKQE